MGQAITHYIFLFEVCTWKGPLALTAIWKGYEAHFTRQMPFLLPNQQHWMSLS